MLGAAAAVGTAASSLTAVCLTGDTTASACLAFMSSSQRTVRGPAHPGGVRTPAPPPRVRTIIGLPPPARPRHAARTGYRAAHGRLLSALEAGEVRAGILPGGVDAAPHGAVRAAGVVAQGRRAWTAPHLRWQAPGVRVPWPARRCSRGGNRSLPVPTPGRRADGVRDFEAGHHKTGPRGVEGTPLGSTDPGLGGHEMAHQVGLESGPVVDFSRLGSSPLMILVKSVGVRPLWRAPGRGSHRAAGPRQYGADRARPVPARRVRGRAPRLPDGQSAT